MAAIWLTVVLGAITAITGGLAGHLAAQNKVQRWLFWGAALVSVGLFVYQGHLIQRDNEAAEARGRVEQSQLNRIEKNTEQAPIITVNTPPPVKPNAVVTLVKFESQYVSTPDAAGNKRGVWFLPDHPVGINVYFANNGAASADNAKGFAKAYLSATADQKTEDGLIAKFVDESKKALSKIKTGAMETGGRDLTWYTGLSEKALAQSDINKLLTGNLHLYFFVTNQYTDPTGSHYAHYCRILQPPGEGAGNSEAVWQNCFDFKDHH